MSEILRYPQQTRITLTPAGLTRLLSGDWSDSQYGHLFSANGKVEAIAVIVYFDGDGSYTAEDILVYPDWFRESTQEFRTDMLRNNQTFPERCVGNAYFLGGCLSGNSSSPTSGWTLGWDSNPDTLPNPVTTEDYWQRLNGLGDYSNAKS